MGKDQEVLKKLTVVQLKRILTDYNKKIRKKEYQGVSGMKKSEVVAELNKMYTWRHQDKKDKVSFLRKGKQHSFVLGIRGKLEAHQDYDERMKKKKDRKKAISKVLVKKKVIGKKLAKVAKKKKKMPSMKEVEDMIKETQRVIARGEKRRKNKKKDTYNDEKFMIKDMSKLDKIKKFVSRRRKK